MSGADEINAALHAASEHRSADPRPEQPEREPTGHDFMNAALHAARGTRLIPHRTKESEQ